MHHQGQNKTITSFSWSVRNFFLLIFLEYGLIKASLIKDQGVMKMKQKQMLALATTGFILSSCLGPQTYFSAVFSTLKDLYFPILDNNDRLVMNYAMEAAITVDDETRTFDVYFFNTGIKLLAVIPTTVNEVATTETLTLVYDYAEDGYFAKRVYANNPQGEEKIYRDFEDDTFDIFLEGVNTAESILSDEVESVINNQATNLIIGGQPAAQDVKKYTLPIGNFIDPETFEDLVGFVPTDLEVEVEFTTSSKQGKIELNASGDNKSYEVIIIFSQPDLVQASQHLLTPTEKLTYEGYVA
jgi:hypothetical protein